MFDLNLGILLPVDLKCRHDCVFSVKSVVIGGVLPCYLKLAWVRVVPCEPHMIIFDILITIINKRVL